MMLARFRDCFIPSPSRGAIQRTAHAADWSTAPLCTAIARLLMGIMLGVAEQARVKLNCLGILLIEEVTG
jgi:hypothetical protein